MGKIKIDEYRFKIMPYQELIRLKGNIDKLIVTNRVSDLHNEITNSNDIAIQIVLFTNKYKDGIGIWLSRNAYNNYSIIKDLGLQEVSSGTFMRPKKKKEEKEIKNCPFCGGRGTVIRQQHIEVYNIRCNNCGAASSLYNSRTTAIERWNMRLY